MPPHPAPTPPGLSATERGGERTWGGACCGSVASIVHRGEVSPIPKGSPLEWGQHLLGSVTQPIPLPAGPGLAGGLTLTLHQLGPGHLWCWWVYVLKLRVPAAFVRSPAPDTWAGPRREPAGHGRGGRGSERSAAWAPDRRRDGARSCAGDSGSPRAFRTREKLSPRKGRGSQPLRF